MKIKKFKYILCLICLVLFLWYSVAGPDVSSTNSCQSANSSTNPANNSGNVNNPDWYYNSSEWMIWWYNVHTSSTPIQWNISDIIGYKLTLLKKFDGAAWNSSPSSVWHLQNALKIISTCTTVNRDCKLWTVTNDSFFGCDICKWIDSSYEQPVSLNSSSDIVCPNWKEKVTEWSWANLCCKQIHCDNPQDTGWWCASYWPSYTIDWSGCCATSCEKPQSATWCASYWPSYTIDWSGCCATTCDKPQDSSWLCASYWTTYILSGTCCVENQCSNPPHPTEWCTWWLVLWAGGCCEEASSICPWDNQYLPEWWSWSSDCAECETWTKPNEAHTKCICDSSKKCCWIQLNTVVPFIWDCIEMNTDSSRWDTTSVTSATAFPVLVQWLMKILMSAIMVFSFLMVIVAWLMMTTWAFSWWNFTKWKTILKNVIISLILLWCSWLILSLVNPSFFGG